MQSSIRMNRAFTQVRPQVAARPVSVVAAKPTKASEFRELSNVEVIDKMKSLKVELASARFLMKTQGVSQYEPGSKRPEAQPENADTFRFMRRQVAQLNTVLRERQIADGIDRRAAKKIEKKAGLAAGYATHL
eukprot:gene31114-6246_t